MNQTNKFKFRWKIFTMNRFDEFIWCLCYFYWLILIMWKTTVSCIWITLQSSFVNIIIESLNFHKGFLYYETTDIIIHAHTPQIRSVSFVHSNCTQNTAIPSTINRCRTHKHTCEYDEFNEYDNDSNADCGLSNKHYKWPHNPFSFFLFMCMA